MGPDDAARVGTRHPVTSGHGAAAIPPWAVLHLGYRSLNFNYSADNSSLGFNVHMKGPLLVASFWF